MAVAAKVKLAAADVDMSTGLTNHKVGAAVVDYLKYQDEGFGAMAPRN